MSDPKTHKDVVPDQPPEKNDLTLGEKAESSTPDLTLLESPPDPAKVAEETNAPIVPELVEEPLTLEEGPPQRHRERQQNQNSGDELTRIELRAILVVFGLLILAPLAWLLFLFIACATI